MKRKDLEHLIRAAGAIAQSKELVIVGSQAILGMYPDPPDELVVSQEADLYPADDPNKADLIDGSIGELSPFHREFGYYAHGVGPETAVLPVTWKSRVIRVENENTGGVAGLCLHPADLAAGKLVAAREKDIDFVKNMIRYGLLTVENIASVLTELPEDYVDSASHRLKRLIQ